MYYIPLRPSLVLKANPGHLSSHVLSHPDLLLLLLLHIPFQPLVPFPCQVVQDALLYVIMLSLSSWQFLSKSISPLFGLSTTCIANPLFPSSKLPHFPSNSLSLPCDPRSMELSGNVFLQFVLGQGCCDKPFSHQGVLVHIRPMRTQPLCPLQAHQTACCGWATPR